jgi:hypothetical protein
VIRNISRRLERLERRFLPAPISIRIVYVDSQRRVTSTRLVECGTRVQANLNDENDDDGRTTTPDPR